MKGFFNSVLSYNFRHGAQMMLQLSGLGQLKPNTLVLGYKEKFWTEGPSDEPSCVEYVQIISDAFSMGVR